MLRRVKFPRKIGLALTASAVVAFAAAPAVTGNPAAAQTAQSISQSDRALGAKAHPQLVAEFGGAMTGPHAAYVENVGKNIAVQSRLSNARTDFNVTLLNSPINNAFAIPGGYVYVTRQLVGLMNNEAELAAVLGHEVGHVAARHAAKREQAAMRSGLLGLLGQVLGAAVGGGFGNIISQGAQVSSQLMTLRYSRGQENEADDLGLQYLRSAGYDPRALSTMLDSLARQSALDARLMGSGSNRVPEWASTHPDPASRVRTTLSKAGANTQGVTNRDVFLSRIDRLMVGDDPQQGIVDGGSFVHPVERFAFQAPSGFYLVNGTRAVSINGQSGQGQLTTAAYNGNLDTYVRAVFSGLTQGSAQLPAATVQRTTVNGLPAAYAVTRASTGNGQVDVAVFAYEFSKSRAFHFVTVAAPGRASAFNPMFSSMRRISANEASAVRPRRIDVYTVRAGDTVQSLARRMAYSTYQVERFLVLNGLGTNAALRPGEKVKLVVY